MPKIDIASLPTDTHTGYPEPLNHVVIGREQSEVGYLEIGTRSIHGTAHYPDVDLVAIRDDKGMRCARKNGESY